MGLSAETPTIVARKQEVKHTLGGAALVCRNLLELGARVDFLTLAGGDEEAKYVRELRGASLKMQVVVEADRPTTVKHRFWVDGYKLFQLDQRDDRPISEETCNGVLSQVDRALPDTDIVVISDYRHGLLSPSLLGRLLPRIHAIGKPVYVDSQVSQVSANHTLYQGGCVICLNLKEARRIDPGFTPTKDARSFAILNRELDTERIVVKLGENGALYQDGTRVTSSPAMNVTVVDSTGAGDAFLAAFCLAGTEDPSSALKLANIWAGLSVQIHGTVPPTKADLVRALEEV